jgi:hypothetical protein
LKDDAGDNAQAIERTTLGAAAPSTWRRRQLNAQKERTNVALCRWRTTLLPLERAEKGHASFSCTSGFPAILRLIHFTWTLLHQCAAKEEVWNKAERTASIINHTINSTIQLQFYLLWIVLQKQLPDSQLSKCSARCSRIFRASSCCSSRSFHFAASKAY